MAPRGNQNAKGNKGGTGRPSSYSAGYVKVVRGMATRGWTEIEMAEALSIDVSTFRRWKHKYPDFLSASESNAEERLLALKRAAFNRATGYSHPAVKIMVVDKEVVSIPYVEHYPPEPSVLKMLLNHHERGQWSDRAEQEQTGTVTVKIEGGLPTSEENQ